MWIEITKLLPMDDVLVMTKVDDEKGERNVQPLVKKGNLWWTKDMGMYVYYTPTHWKNIY